MLAGVAAPALASGDDAALATYVRARAADADGQAMLAAAAYGEVLKAAPDNELVAIRAYRQALSAGDMALALQAERLLENRGVSPVDGALLIIADRVAAGDVAGARAALARLDKTPFDFMAPVIGGWIDYQSDPAAAIAALAAAKPGAFGRRYQMEALALMEIGAGRADAGIAHVQTMGAADPVTRDVRLAAARLLAGQGRVDDARALIPGPDRVFTAAREQLGSGDKDKADTRFGVARFYTRLAAELTSEGTRPLSIMLARSALMIDAKDDRARLVLADMLSREGAFDAAGRVLAEIGPDSIFAQEARAARIVVMERDGDIAGAVDLAALASKDGGGGDARVYGDLLVEAGRMADAAQAYALARQRGAGPEWLLLMAEGGAREKAGDWKSALPLLRRAVELAPEEPLVLNYLGYAQIERGENLDAAQKLIERAHMLKPADPAIIDSLGWAYYLRGDAGRALPLIEQAARAQSSDSDIQEHLGDLYWTLGRRFEARYAWRAAAVYADGDAASRIAAKIGSGLPARRR